MTLLELYPDLAPRLAHQPTGRPLVVKRGGCWLVVCYDGRGSFDPLWHVDWTAAQSDARLRAHAPPLAPWQATPRG